MPESKPLPQAAPHEQALRRETVIAQGVVITGDLQGDSNVEIRGTLEGNVHLQGSLLVGKGARITGDIRATSVVVDGQVTGNIDAREKVLLGRSSAVKGILRTTTLSIQEGALFQGRVEEPPGRLERPSTALLALEKVPA